MLRILRTLLIPMSIMKNQQSRNLKESQDCCVARAPACTTSFNLDPDPFLKLFQVYWADIGAPHQRLTLQALQFLSKGHESLVEMS